MQQFKRFFLIIIIFLTLQSKQVEVPVKLFEKLERPKESFVRLYEENFEKLKESKKIIFFKKNICRYYPNAGWMVSDLSVMDPEDACAAMCILVDIFKGKQWFYFCDQPKDFYLAKYAKNFVEQLFFIIKFLKTSLVDVDKKMIIITNSFQFSKYYNQSNSIISFIEFFKNYDESRFADFFAFYFDCNAIVFIDTVNEAYEKLQSNQQSGFKNDASDIYYKLDQIYMDYLQSSKKFSIKYSEQLKRYKQILNLLDEECINSGLEDFGYDL